MFLVGFDYLKIKRERAHAIGDDFGSIVSQRVINWLLVIQVELLSVLFWECDVILLFERKPALHFQIILTGANFHIW